MYPDSIPDPEKFSSISVNAISCDEDFQEEVEAICRILNREAFFEDANGYRQDVLAAAIDETQQRYSWLESSSKIIGRYFDDHFYLKGILEDIPIINWEVETYNPVFGCQPEFLQWIGDTLVFIYHEKHHTYICSFSGKNGQTLASKPIARYRISDEWRIREGTLFYSSGVVDQVERMSLPGLELLEPWSAQRARIEGTLPPGYDETNESLRKYAKLLEQDSSPAAAAQLLRRLYGGN